METALKWSVLSITGGPRRGPSRANTQLALNSVVNLVETAPDEQALGVLNYLDAWTRRAEALLDPSKALRRLPREPGQKEACCPYCSNHTMRWNPAIGTVICINPACTNDNGVRPRWAARYCVLGDTLQFTWEEAEAA
jgi:hypothetical protein